jgi:predicted RND superfamily exporter protein
VIDEDEPFSLDTFSFIKLEEFIQNIKDKSFEEFNTLFDEELKADLRARLEESILKFKDLSSVDIPSLTEEKKQELYDEVMARYQKLNFIDSQTKDLFDKKIEYKTFLINIATDIQKDALIESTLTDLKETLESKDYSSLDGILNILNENVEKIKGLDINSYFDKDTIGTDLKNAIDKNFEVLENIFGSDISTLVSEGKLQLSDIEAIKDTAKQKIEDGLNTLFSK